MAVVQWMTIPFTCPQEERNSQELQPYPSRLKYYKLIILLKPESQLFVTARVSFQSVLQLGLLILEDIMRLTSTDISITNNLHCHILLH
jgi:hypothetical protein